MFMQDQSRNRFWQLRLLNNMFHHDTVTWWKMHRRSIEIQADQIIKKKQTKQLVLENT